MRITKKLLRDVKRGMNRRVIELCAMLATGKLQEEVNRITKGVKSEGPQHELMRFLLIDLIDLSLPEHWLD